MAREREPPQSAFRPIDERLAPSAEPRPLLLAEAPLARAGLAFGGVPQRAGRDTLVVGDAEVVFLQPADFVAKTRGFLELEIGGSLAHAFLEVGDVGLEVVADEVRALLIAGVDDDPVTRSA